MQIGFSTGSLALADYRRGLRMVQDRQITAIEFSALREHELAPMLAAIPSIETEVAQFDYVSFHAPSRREHLSEHALVDALKIIASRSWPIIVHPDLIDEFALWQKLGGAVCIENMDRRKRTGRTAAELGTFFKALPEATFCFDIGHARQVDPTMQEAETFLRRFGDRLKQVHMSYVNTRGGHERLNFESTLAFRRVSRWIDESIPVILETPVSQEAMEEEIATARDILAATVEAS